MRTETVTVTTRSRFGWCESRAWDRAEEKDNSKPIEFGGITALAKASRELDRIYGRGAWVGLSVWHRGRLIVFHPGWNVDGMLNDLRETGLEGLDITVEVND